MIEWLPAPTCEGFWWAKRIADGHVDVVRAARVADTFFVYFTAGAFGGVEFFDPYFRFARVEEPADLRK